MQRKFKARINLTNMKRINNLIVTFISDVFYYIKGDRSTMYEEIKKIGRKPSWRHYARNPYCGIFKKYLKFTK